jgi:WD40 repeat protein
MCYGADMARARRGIITIAFLFIFTPVALAYEAGFGAPCPLILGDRSPEEIMRDLPSLYEEVLRAGVSRVPRLFEAKTFAAIRAASEDDSSAYFRIPSSSGQGLPALAMRVQEGLDVLARFAAELRVGSLSAERMNRVLVSLEKERRRGDLKRERAASQEQILKPTHIIHVNPEKNFGLHALAFGSDPKQLYVGAWGEVEVWQIDPSNAPTQLEKLKVHADSENFPIGRLAVSPDGSHFLAGFWSPEERRWNLYLVRSADHKVSQILSKESYDLRAVSFSWDGSEFMYVPSWPRPKVMTTRELAVVERAVQNGPFRMLGAVFSPSSRKVLAVSDSGKTQVFDMTQVHERVIDFIPEHKDATSLAIAPDESFAVIGTRFHGLFTYDLEGKRNLHLPSRDAVRSVAVSPDSHLIALGYFGGSVLVMNRFGEVLEYLPAENGSSPTVISFSPDGQWLVIGYLGNEIHLYRVPSGWRR